MGVFFFGVPRNETGSLIKDPSIVSFQEYVQQIKILSDEAEVVVRSMPIMDETEVFQSVDVRTTVDYVKDFFDKDNIDVENEEEACRKAVQLDDDEAKFDFSPGYMFEEED